MKAGWRTEPLGKVAYLAGRIGWKGLTAKEYTEEGPLFLSVHGLNYGAYVDFRDANHISQARYDESPEITLRSGDVLICKDGAGIGKVGIIGELPGPATINSSLLLIRANHELYPKYVYYVLLSPYFQEIVQSRLDGATTPHLYQREIATFPIRFPSLCEQKSIVAILDDAFDAMSTLRKLYEERLVLLDGLGEALLHKAFTGELSRKAHEMPEPAAE
jgi:type I restriction enzyme S subunit